MRFLAEAAPEEVRDVVLEFGEDSLSAPFVLPTKNLSDRIRFEARRGVVKTVAGGKRLATIELPEEGDEFVVILVTAPKGGYAPIVVPMDDARFGRGDVMLFNRTSTRLRGKIGTSPVVLQPNEQKFVRPADVHEGGFYEVFMAGNVRGKERLVASSRWPEDQLLRRYVFFFETEEGRITYRAVDEFIPRDPPRR